MMYRGRSGISPVVATVILVAIAIVIAIAVAFWATGLVGVFTRFEKLEVTSAYYEENEGVVLTIRNTGSADASIDDIYVNGRPCAGGCDINQTLPLTMKVGDLKGITIGRTPSGDWIHGVTYEIMVHTASGKSYPVAVLIP